MNSYPLSALALAFFFCLALPFPVTAVDAGKGNAPAQEVAKDKTSPKAVTPKRQKTLEQQADKASLGVPSGNKAKSSSRSKGEKSPKAKTDRDGKKKREKGPDSKKTQDRERTKDPQTREVDGRQNWLTPQVGKASWYGPDFHGALTASGLDYDMFTFTAAHRTLPMGTVVRVTDNDSGKSVMVCVTDRGPFVRGRIIDLSYAAAQQLNLDKKGVAKVSLEVVSDSHGAPLLPDQAYYVRYLAAHGLKELGPFQFFADAAAMHEALCLVHPDAEIILAPQGQP